MDQRRSGLGPPFKLYILSGLQPNRRYNASPRSSMRRLHPPGYTQNGTLTKPPDDEFDNGYSETVLQVEEQSDKPSPVTQLLEKQFTRSAHAHSHIWCTEETRGGEEERIKNAFVDEQGDSHYYDDLSGEDEAFYDNEFTLFVSTFNKLTQVTSKRKGYPNDEYQQGIEKSIKNQDNSRNKESQRSIEIKVETSRETQEPPDKKDPEALDAVNNASSKTGPLSKSVISQESSEKLADPPTADRSPDISMIPSGSDHMNSVDCSTEFSVPKPQHFPEKLKKKAEEIKNSPEDRSVGKKKRDFVTSNNEKVQPEPKQWIEEEMATQINEKAQVNLLSSKQHSGKTSVHFDAKEENKDSQKDFESLYTDHPLDDEAFGTVNEDYYTDTSYGKENVPTSEQMPNAGRYSYGVNQFLNMPIFMQSIRKFATDSQFELHDVTADGNCMFRAMEDQLNINGDLGYTPKMLRQTAVRYLRNNPCQSDRSRLEDFLESWEEYLTRMQQNFQSGDHMILKALADALNLTIIVINVYEDDIKRTEIPAEGRPVTRRQKLTIFLGHIGEFHYLSLRPADWEKTGHTSLIRRMQVNCQTEDSEKLLKMVEQKIGKKAIETYIPKALSDDKSSKKEESVFVPDLTSCFESYGLDHLQLEDTEETRKALIGDLLSTDTVTGLTLPHVSFILNGVLNIFDELIFKTPFKGLGDMKITIEDGTDLGMILYGATADGTNVYIRNLRPGSKMQYEMDKKFMNSPTLVVFHPEETVAFPNVKQQSSSESSIYADESETHPGYCRLKPGYSCKHIWLFWSVLNGEIYIKALDFPENIKNAVASIGIRKQFCGCNCSSFPLSVRKEWRSLEKSTSCWPSAQVKETVIACGCLVINKAHPKSRLTEVEWKFVFAEGEKILIKKGLTLIQRRTFLIFKLLVEHSTRHSPRPLKNKHLKHVFFYACETIPSDPWESNIGGCLIYVLAYLLNCLREHCIPHYFIAENNLLDYYSEEDVQNLCVNIEALRVFPVQCLKQLFGAYGWEAVLTSRLSVLNDCKHFARTKDINHSWTKVFIPAITKSIKYLIHMHWYEGAYTCLKLSYEEEILLAPVTSKRPSFPDFFLDVLNTVEDFTEKKNLAKFYDREFNTDIQAQNRKDLILVRDVVNGKVDENVGGLEVPKYCAHNTLELAHWLDDRARVSYYSGAFKMAKELGLTSVSCAKGLLREQISFTMNEFLDENLKAEIKQQTSTVVNSLITFYEHLIFTCSPFQNFDILREELKDLESFRLYVPIIFNVIEFIKSRLKNPVGKDLIFVRDVVNGKVDENVGRLEVPKYCAHNTLELAHWLDDKARVSYVSGAFKMAKELVLTSVSCAKRLLREQISFTMNELPDENLKAEIKQQTSTVVNSLINFYEHLIYTCSPFQNFDILREELKDLESFRSSVPIIGSVIEFIKSRLKNPVGKDLIVVRDVVKGKVDENVARLEVPKYCAHNTLELAHWLDEKARVFYFSGAFKMAIELVLTSVSCAKGLLREQISFTMNDLPDQNLKAEIKQQTSTVVNSLINFYEHLIYTCSPFQNFDILREELKDLESFRSSVPIIGSVIGFIKSRLKNPVGKGSYLYVY